MQARWTEWPPRRPRWQQLALAAAASVGAVVVVTGVIALVDSYVPVLSLGVLYVFAVLPIAVLWGLWFAVPVSVASMLAFNWFFLPPIHTFTLADSENWFALAVYLCTAIVVSDLAARARRRAAAAEQRERESALLAELATELLGGRALEDELDEIAHRAADVLGVDHAEIELGVRTARRPGRRPTRSRPRTGRWGRSTRPRDPSRTSPFAAASCPRSPRCSPSRSSTTSSSRTRSRPRRSGAATSSRPRCSAPCHTISARR